ncbi:MAG TPA: hypothetical protein DDW98_10915, partial [Gammaproteobacteria bacterium]|nr:hypothetical protein [Gammaproteobacteria bacterium]
MSDRDTHLSSPADKPSRFRYWALSLGLHGALVVIFAVIAIWPRPRPVQPSGGPIIQANLVDMREVNRQAINRQEARERAEAQAKAEANRRDAEAKAEAAEREKAAAEAEAEARTKAEAARRKAEADAKAKAEAAAREKAAAEA